MQGYNFIAVFLLISTFAFLIRCVFAQSASMSGVFYFLIDTLMLLIPILTMRLMAEERKNKTDQLLLCSPVSLVRIVLGKFLAACALFFFTSALTIIFPIVMAIYGAQVAPWEILLGYLGFWLLGLALISVGLFISSLTEHQTVALLLTLLSVAFLMIVLDVLVIQFGGALGTALKWLSLWDRYIMYFDSGVLSLSSILYYLTFSAAFIVFTIRLIERRRWAKG
jgi:ABC-2 type transport system permease protein